MRSRTVKKYKATTDSKHNLPVAENVLNQSFAEKPNQVWMADITYIQLDEGWLSSPVWKTCAHVRSSGFTWASE
ncbi:hypothetical protein P7H12_25805 [Paenibacillus larvae]|nr:hypothetical protein [Paenibacillus larvae]MDT2266334.1 hypothetical protein [Paenibacillus larvae]